MADTHKLKLYAGVFRPEEVIGYFHGHEVVLRSTNNVENAEHFRYSCDYFQELLMKLMSEFRHKDI